MAYRIANDRPWITGRSFCPNCKNTLTWWQLIPLLSFLGLRGRCFYCRKPISWQYPIVELLTGLTFLLAHFYIVNPLLLALSLPVITILIFIALYDFREYLIIDAAVVIAALSGLAVAYVKGDIYVSVISGLALFGFFWGIHKLSEGKWIGFGDVKLGIALGIINGPLVMLTLVFASWLGTLVGLALMAIGRAHLKSKLPFGTFLSISSILVLIFSSFLAGYFVNIFGYADYK